ncbi:hypothetical protein ACQEV4_33525 [Streptomyces shenzhenensis]|uniref:hypothetical protein n=1 Tax=Streptomyces shenzhenensis TaxID=943815 RepID=UPI003D93C47C
MADRDAVWRGLDTVLERSFTRRDAARYARPAGRTDRAAPGPGRSWPRAVARAG